MKLLFDQNISYKLVVELRHIFPGPEHVKLVGLESAADDEIWQYARKNEFVIVTQDSDFYERSLVLGYPPKIIWLRTGNTHTQHIKQLLIANHQRISQFVDDQDSGCLEIY